MKDEGSRMDASSNEHVAGGNTGAASVFPNHDHERDLGQAVWRGWRRRCPACGTGPMMKGYLTVRDTCTVCGEEMHHHRADDGPAWLTIILVGHLMAPVLGATYMHFRPDPMVLSAVFAIGTVALSLWLLPRFKGLMVGFQWAKRMHGFAPGMPDPARGGA